MGRAIRSTALPFASTRVSAERPPTLCKPYQKNGNFAGKTIAFPFFRHYHLYHQIRQLQRSPGLSAPQGWLPSLSDKERAVTTTILDRPARAASLLKENAVSDLRNLNVTESDDEIVISGIVSSYYLKQMAQEAVRPALAGRRLRNRVIVLPPK